MAEPMIPMTAAEFFEMWPLWCSIDSGVDRQTGEVLSFVLTRIMTTFEERGASTRGLGIYRGDGTGRCVWQSPDLRVVQEPV